MTKTTAEGLPLDAIAIVGCGLIGCSIAAALKARGFRGRVLGCGRPGKNLETALASGYVDATETDPAVAARSCDLVVVSTPVDRIVADARAAARGCRPGTILTDTGSVKRAICEPLASGLPAGVTFVGSHPIAGSEKQGCAHASAELFEGRVCVVTPTKNCEIADVARVVQFWETLGMTVVEMSSADHDRVLAQTSHVPHLVAAALAASLEVANVKFTAGGFQDTTRVAAGDPALWTAILLGNADESAAGLRAVSTRIAEFQRALEARDEAALIGLLRAAKKRRDLLPRSGLPGGRTFVEGSETS